MLSSRLSTNMASLVSMLAWSQHFGGWCNSSNEIGQGADYSCSHLYWNGGYFGTIFTVKEYLPKAKVRLSYTNDVGLFFLILLAVIDCPRSTDK